MWRAAIKFAYEGKNFNGSQRQPGVRTVEGEVIRGLKKIGAMDDPVTARFKVASRTDAGVSALGNLVCFDTEFSRDRILHALNAVCDDVYFIACREVAPSFSPRRAKERWYRYFLADDGIDMDLLISASRLFVGRHDFRRFCKPEGRATVKTVNNIVVTKAGGLFIIDLYAREFLRNMVRRMVAAMEKAGRGTVTVADIREALEGRDISFGLADPYGLCLMDIIYDIDFKAESTEPMKRKVGEKREEALLELFFYDSLLDIGNDDK